MNCVDIFKSHHSPSFGGMCDCCWLFGDSSNALNLQMNLLFGYRRNPKTQIRKEEEGHKRLYGLPYMSIRHGISYIQDENDTTALTLFFFL